MILLVMGGDQSFDEDSDEDEEDVEDDVKSAKKRPAQKPGPKSSVCIYFYSWLKMYLYLSGSKLK